MHFNINSDSPEERSAILRALFKLGYRWHGDSSYTPELVEDEFPQSNFGCIGVTPGISRIGGNGYCLDSVSFSSFLKSHHIEVKTTPWIDGVHDVTILKDEVKIGCQSFQKEKIKELAEIVKNFK